ncbi:MAG: nucleoside hydrolase [Acidimicrobiaceae bacterium]|nr:nucleoside hydrolase [Acidimicrobiaceae bacterium]MDE0607102.1 nucleoside hydrolase [Acidimicrobiaceae bacterium]
MSLTPVPMLVDCDPGLDDAIALLTAAHFADLVGITTVDGNVGIDYTTRNALAVAQIAGLDVEVHRGAARPLADQPRGARHVHGATGLGDVELPEITRSVESEDAVGFIIETSHRVEGLHLVAVGPLTNVAEALQQDASLPERLGGLTLMGGAAVGGNVTAAAEFNIWADPEAADVVFRLGGNITMVGLDVTQRVLLGPTQVDQMRTARTPASSLAADLLDYAISRSSELRGWTGAPIHDACAVLAVTHPQLFDGRRQPVDIELAGTHTRGMTVVDDRGSDADSDANARVLRSADADAVIELIVEAVTAVR